MPEWGMPDRSRKKKPADPNRMAAAIVAESTGEDEDQPVKLAAAVELGRRGGLKGGPARKKKLSAKRRKEIAKKAADARWAKKR